MPLRFPAQRFEESTHLYPRSLERHRRKPALVLKMLKIGIEQPVIGLFNLRQLGWFDRFDFNQVTEQQLQHASRHDLGRVIRASSSCVDEINFQKRFDEGIGDLPASGDSALDPLHSQTSSQLVAWKLA